MSRDKEREEMAQALKPLLQIYSESGGEYRPLVDNVLAVIQNAEAAARAKGRREEWDWLRGELERLRKVSGWKVELAESLKSREAAAIRATLDEGESDEK